MPAAPIMAPAYLEASKPPAPDLEAGGGGALPVSSSSGKAAPPPPTAVVGAALPPADDKFSPLDGDGNNGPFDPSSSPPKRGCGLSPALVGWLLFALGWLLSLIWIVGLPLANALPSSCGKQSAVLLASPNPLAQLVNYERLRTLVECRIMNNISLTATGALCLIPWLLGSLLPCCCTRAKRSNQQACASLAAAKSRRSLAARANTAMAVLGTCALAGLIAMCAVEYREAAKMDTPEQRAQLESLSQVAVAGKELATGVDAVLESVGQALGIAPPPGVGSAASGDGLLGQLFKP